MLTIQREINEMKMINDEIMKVKTKNLVGLMTKLLWRSIDSHSSPLKKGKNEKGFIGAKETIVMSHQKRTKDRGKNRATANKDDEDEQSDLKKWGLLVGKFSESSTAPLHQSLTWRN